jgi:hypothetical protein
METRQWQDKQNLYLIRRSWRTCLRAYWWLRRRRTRHMGNGAFVELIMQQVNSIALVKVREATDLSQAQSDVVLNGNSTGIIVPGEELEAAVQVNDRSYILFLTDNVVFEESLTIALIDVRNGVKEIVHLGHEYSTGSFENLTVTGDSVSFNFIGDYIWTLQVSDSPRLRLPFASDPGGVKRKPGLKKYITISASPAPKKVR